uniref:Uncharacterized protein n=1 Tax=Ixodes ricinus TaxID=34613 RepID=A0A6B0UID3_IXORI
MRPIRSAVVASGVLTRGGCICDPPTRGPRCRFESEWDGRFYLLASCTLFFSMTRRLGASVRVRLLRPTSVAKNSRSETNDLSFRCTSLWCYCAPQPITKS